MAVLIIAGNYAVGKKAYAQEKPTIEDIAGTWVNTEMTMDKIVYKTDATWSHYTYLTVDIPTFEGTFTIEDILVDKKGNKFFKVIKKPSSINMYIFELVRINESGTVLELIVRDDFEYKSRDDISEKFPSEINPRSLEGTYLIMYRL